MNYGTIIRDAILIALAGSVFGIGYNFLSAGGIPIVGEHPREVLDGIVPEISLAEAKDLFDSEGIVFVDARSSGEHARKRIKGAVSIPYGEFVRYPSIPDGVVKAEKLVIYCGSAKCNLALKLADQFVSLGITHIEVFAGGLKEWDREGYPVEAGRVKK